MIIKESQLRKIIREILIESDETVSMDPSIFKMMAPASLVNKEKSKPKILSPKPLNPKPLEFDHQSFAELIVHKLSDKVNLKEINKEFLEELFKKITNIVERGKQNVQYIKKNA